MAQRRPELTLPAEIYYDHEGAKKYARSSRIHVVQRQMTERAIELLQLPPSERCLLLDVGCGSGVSSRVLHDRGHVWVGTDLSLPMLKIAKDEERAEREDGEHDEDGDESDSSCTESDYDEEEEEAEENEDDGDSESDDGEDDASPTGEHQSVLNEEDATNSLYRAEVIQNDMGTGVPFRPGIFDGAISISAVQWLCNIDKRGQIPQRRLRTFFQTLYNSLRRGARAVLQFFPENPQQTHLITAAAEKAGFGGGLVIDYPHSARARKHYLVIYAGLAPAGYVPPRPLGVDDDVDVHDKRFAQHQRDEADADPQRIPVYKRERSNKKQGGRGKRGTFAEGDDGSCPEVGTKSWIRMKKTERRSRGYDVKPDSKYTARRRPRAF